MALTLHDAFLVPLYCGEIGIPMLGMAILSSLDAVGGDLGARVAAQRDLFVGHGPGVAGQIREVEQMLARHQLAVPPRPNTALDYLRWSDAAVKAIADATGPEIPEGAIAALGRCLGETMQALATRIMVVWLREVALDHASLRELDGEWAQRLAKHVAHLDAMARFPTLPAVARAHAEKLASFAKMAVVMGPEVAIATQNAGLKLVFGKLSEHIRELRAALPA